MSVPVPLERLWAAIAERGGRAYVLTVSDDGTPHAVHAPVRWEGELLSADVGRRSAANVGARPAVSVLYPVRSDDDYSLIVDGTATVASGDGGQRLLVTPTRAVLHRQARSGATTASSCDADCVPLFPPPRRA
jgi:hypothetical protein